MAKVFQTERQRIVAYAAFKHLERMLKEDGDIAPGTYQDVSFERLELTLPQGTVVEREVGTNGDGTIYKKATQNLYGYTILALLIAKLKKFKQWLPLRTLILEVVKEAVLKGKPTEDEAKSHDPDFTSLLEEVRKEVSVQPRKEQTPRLCKENGMYATLGFLGRKSKAS